jgi:uncharacterized protein (TIRG00374 family)
MRNRLLNVAKLALSLGFLALVLARVGLRQAVGTLVSADWPLLGLALALYIAGIALRALRWRALLQAKGVEVPLSRLVVLYYVGSFFNLMLPTGVGGDAVRMYELSRHTRTPELAVGTVLADRAVGLLVLFLLATAVLPFGAGLPQPWVAWLVVALTAGSFGAVALALWERPLAWAYRRLPPRLQSLVDRPPLHKLYRSLTGYNARSLAVVAGVSLAFNLLLVTVNVLIGLGLGVHVPARYYVVFISLIAFASALPISLGGLGVREGGYTALFGQVGVPQAVALSMSLAFYLITVLSGLIGGALYAWEGARGAWRPAGKESRNA